MAHIIISLQPDWNVKVQTGDKVTFDTALAETSHNAPISHIIPIATILKFKADKIFKHLKKNIGDKIYKGDVLATKDGVLSTKKYLADTEGILLGVNHHTGEITVEENPGDSPHSTIPALVEGIIGTSEHNSLQCKVGKTLSIDLKEAVEERFGGRTIITDSEHAVTLTLPQVRGAIIIAPDFSEYVLSKLAALGAARIITPKEISKTSTIDCVIQNPDAIQSIIDFVPTAVYANAADTCLTFYK